MCTSWCIATLALRMRVSMSAIGSVIVIVGLPSPARLGHARHLAGVHELAQADPAEAELSVERARPTAPAAPVVRTDLVLGLALLLLDQRLLRHLLSPFPGLGGLLHTTHRAPPALLPGNIGLTSRERETEGIEQSPAARVVGRGRDDRDVHATGDVDAVVVDLREDQLLVDTERVVAPAVPRRGGKAAEVADPGDGDRDEAVEELPHAVAPQGHLGP